MINYNSRIFLGVVFVLAIMLQGSNTTAQLTGVKSMPGDYATIAAFVTDLNAQGVGPGGVTLSVPAGHTETAPAGGIIITATGTPTDPIAIQGAGMPLPVITASSAQVIGNLNDAIFVLHGCDYVTISGLQLEENAGNTTTAVATNNMTEWGIALLYLTNTDGAQFNTIQNNTISLNKAYANTFGIYSNTRHTIASVTATADITNITGSNSNNKIYGNTISNVNLGIAFVGCSTTMHMDMGNDIGGTTAMTGNTLTNWGGQVVASGYVSVSGTCWGIYSNHQTGENISNNTITSAAITPPASFRGIFKDYSNGQPSGTFTTTISGNTITLSSAATSGTFEAIRTQGLTPVLSTATLTIDNNTILNCSISGAASSSALVGISNSCAVGSLSISNNIIRSNTSTATTGGFTGVVNSGACNGTINLNNNQVGNMSGNAITFSAATSGAVFGVSNTGGTATCALSISSNSFTGFVHNVNGSSAHIYINNTAATLSQNLSNNSFNNLSIASSGSATFFVNAPLLSATGSMTINNNTIVTGFAKTVSGGTVIFHSTNASSVNGSTVSYQNNNLSNITVTGTTGFTGINNTDGASSSNGPTKTVSNNILNNISTPGTGAFNLITINFSGANSLVSSNTVSNISCNVAVTGIALGSSNQGTFNVTSNSVSSLTSSGGTVTGISNAVPAICNVSENIITGLTVTGAFTAVGITTSGANSFVSRNKIYGLTANNAGGTAFGLTISGGANPSVYNNVIGNLAAPLTSLATDAVRGINITSTTASSTIKVYYNTVYLNATSAGANFSTSGIFHAASATPTTASLDLRNNIIINESVANGTGLTLAYRRSTTALNNYAATSNRNLFYAGVPSATNLILFDGVAYQTMAAFQAYVAPREVNSFTGEAFTYATPGSFFISLTGSSSDFLKPVAGISTQVESGGAQITAPAITTDYAGVIRALEIGYAGTGSNPDLGAFEFEGTQVTPVVTINSLTPGTTSLCSSTARLVSANATTPAGTITGVMLNYSFNGVVQAPIAMTNTVGTTWEANIPVATPANATVSWSVTATNSAGLSATTSGTSYADEPLFGLTAVASATQTVICNGETSDLSVLLSNPAAAPAYIAPPAVTNAVPDEDIGNVTISQGATIILNNTTGVTSLVGTIGTATGTAGSYSNFTSFGPYSVTAGQTYNYSIGVVDAAPSYYNNAVAIYIDYNRNGVFTDAGEQVYSSGVLTNGPHTESGTFVVPASASAGLTRMRVISNETSLITSPTQTVSYGEYEEYTLNILPAVSLVDWSDGVASVGTGSPLTVTPATTTTYTASVTSSGCVFAPAPTVTVTVNPLPTAPAATNSSHCGTQVPTASVTSTTGAMTPTFNWYDAPTAGTLLQSSTSATYTSTVGATVTFYVSEEDVATGCESSRTAVTITVITADGISAMSSSATVCIGDSFDLTAANTNPTPVQNYSYTWTGVAGSGADVPVMGTVVSITPTTPGTYTYDVTGVDGGCSAVAQVMVTVDPFSATLTAVDITCNGFTDGTFTLATSSCGTMPYLYSVDGGAAGAIPTNLAVGTYSIVVEDDNGYQTAPIVISIAQPATTIANPTASGLTICQDDLTAMVSATSTTSDLVPGTLVVGFDVLTQPAETNAAPGNIISTTTYTLPAGAVVTSATLTWNNITTIGTSWTADVRLGFSGAVVNAAAQGTGTTNNPGTFNYTRAIPAGAISPSGTVNLLYWDDYNDNVGSADATFQTGMGVAMLTINYTTPAPATISWWDAATNGTQLGTGSPFEAIGTSVLPDASIAGTYTLYAQGQDGPCPSPARTAVNVTVNPTTTSNIVVAQCDPYTLNSTTYSTTGIYTQTVTNSMGCDSIITLDLTINSNSSNTIVAACDSYLWTDGNTYTAGGTYMQTLTNMAGCDSIAILNLTINTANGSTTLITACDAYTWTDGNTYTVDGIFTQTLTNVNGCDSVATLDLTISTANGSTTLITACDAYTWTDGNTYTVDGIFTQTLTNVGGCDSVATLDLTINNAAVPVATDNGDATITSSAGSSYEWIDCGTGLPIAGETSQTLTVIVNGSYAVVVTDGNGCSDTSACVDINYMTVGEQGTAIFRIYPNPTQGMITVTMDAPVALIEVLDAQGKLIAAFTVEDNGQIDLSDLERGVYYLRLKTDDAFMIHKVVLQ
jgi:trimeric autotransporter adhesin